MKITNSNIFDFARDPFLRFDIDNVTMRKGLPISESARLSEYITFIETGKPITRDDYSMSVTENIHLLVRNIVDGDIDYANLVYINDEKADELTAFRADDGDIILAISANCGAACLFASVTDLKVTLSHYLCRIKVDTARILPQYLVYYLNTNMMKSYFRGVETGKGQQNLSKVYVKQAPVIVPDTDIQKRIIESVSSIEASISSLKSRILPVQNIIDSVFANEFSFDFTRFNELKKESVITADISSFANNPDLRFSAKFHREAATFVMSQLQGITSKKIKDFISEPIVLGASVSPNDYSDDGDKFYISMATIKNWCFDSEDAKTVFERYFDTKQTKTVSKNDILMARSGEGTIGKVALIDNDEVQGVFADFTMRIRLKNYNAKFAYYYLRCSYFQYLVEVYKKGLGNNTNIFPSTIQEFPIPDISTQEQERIVAAIQNIIDGQEEIKMQISQKREEINIIIERVLTHEPKECV